MISTQYCTLFNKVIQILNQRVVWNFPWYILLFLSCLLLNWFCLFTRWEEALQSDTLPVDLYHYKILKSTAVGGSFFLLRRARRISTSMRFRCIDPVVNLCDGHNYLKLNTIWISLHTASPGSIVRPTYAEDTSYLWG